MVGGAINNLAINRLSLAAAMVVVFAAVAGMSWYATEPLRR